MRILHAGAWVSMTVLVWGGFAGLARAEQSCGEASLLERAYPACARQAVAKFFPEFADGSKLPALVERADEFLLEHGLPSRCDSEVAAPVPGPEGLTDLVRFIADDYPRVVTGALTAGIRQGEGREIEGFLEQCAHREEALHRLALQAAAEVYHLEAPAGYEVKDRLTFDNTGIKAYLLYPKDRNQPPIVSFSGTENKTDWIQNSTWSVEQLTNARNRFDAWVSRAQKELGTGELIVTGHSLGGGLAQSAVATMTPSSRARIHLVTFNAFRAADQFELFASAQGASGKELLKPNMGALVDGVHYRLDGDVVSRLGHSLGGQSRTMSFNADSEAHWWKKIPGVQWGLTSYESHVIGSLRGALSRDEHALSKSCPQELPTFSERLNWMGRNLFRFKRLKDEVKALGRLVIGWFTGLAEKRENEPLFKDPRLETLCVQGDVAACARGAKKKIAEGEYTDAREALKIACERKSLNACVELGNVYLTLGETRRAELVWNEACLKKDGTACYLLADRLEKQGTGKPGYFKLACYYGEKRACSRFTGPRLGE